MGCSILCCDYYVSLIIVHQVQCSVILLLSLLTIIGIDLSRFPLLCGRFVGKRAELGRGSITRFIAASPQFAPCLHNVGLIAICNHVTRYGSSHVLMYLFIAKLRNISLRSVSRKTAMATVSLDKYDELKARFLRVDRSYESLKSLSRKGICDLCVNIVDCVCHISFLFPAISEFEDLRNRYKQLGKNVIEYSSMFFGYEFKFQSPSQFQKEKQDHEETKNKLNDNIQEHEKLRESGYSNVLTISHLISSVLLSSWTLKRPWVPSINMVIFLVNWRNSKR